MFQYRNNSRVHLCQFWYPTIVACLRTMLHVCVCVCASVRVHMPFLCWYFLLYNSHWSFDWLIRGSSTAVFLSLLRERASIAWFRLANSRFARQFTRVIDVYSRSINVFVSLPVGKHKLVFLNWNLPYWDGWTRKYTGFFEFTFLTNVCAEFSCEHARVQCFILRWHIVTTAIEIG